MVTITFYASIPLDEYMMDLVAKLNMNRSIIIREAIKEYGLKRGKPFKED